MNMKLIKNLEKETIPNITKINRVPGIEEFVTKDGKLFGIKYFLFFSLSYKVPIVIRFTSLDKSFSKLYTIDIYNKKMQPELGIHFKEDMPDAELIKFISSLSKSIKYKKNIYEGSIVERYLSRLSEGKWTTAWRTTKELAKERPDLAVSLFITVFSFALLIGLSLKFWIAKIKNWIEETYVSGELEQQMNEKLFEGQKSDEPAFKVYAELENFIKFVALGKAPAVILCGPPGMSKTYMVKRTFYFSRLKPGRDYNIEKGSSLSPQATYDLLYKNKNRILVLDDFDTPLQDETTVNMLKAITDSYDKRILSFPRERLMSRDDGQTESQSPRKFEYSGKLIIITNLEKSKLDRALLSRAPAFEVNFNTKEILGALEKMVRFVNPNVPEEVKREVLNYILELYRKQSRIEIDFRAFKNSIDARVGNPMYWKDMVKTIVGYK